MRAAYWSLIWPSSYEPACAWKIVSLMLDCILSFRHWRVLNKLFYGLKNCFRSYMCQALVLERSIWKLPVQILNGYEDWKKRLNFLRHLSELRLLPFSRYMLKFSWIDGITSKILLKSAALVDLNHMLHVNYGCNFFCLWEYQSLNCHLLLECSRGR